MFGLLDRPSGYGQCSTGIDTVEHFGTDHLAVVYVLQLISISKQRQTRMFKTQYQGQDCTSRLKDGKDETSAGWCMSVERHDLRLSNVPVPVDRCMIDSQSVEMIPKKGIFFHIAKPFSQEEREYRRIDKSVFISATREYHQVPAENKDILQREPLEQFPRHEQYTNPMLLVTLCTKCTK